MNIRMGLGTRIRDIRTIGGSGGAQFRLLAAGRLDGGSGRREGRSNGRTGLPRAGCHYRSLMITANKLSVPAVNTDNLNCRLTRRFNRRLVSASTDLMPFAFASGANSLVHTLTNVDLPIVTDGRHVSFGLPVLFARHKLSNPTVLRLSGC